jgi:hypothetical protein
MVRNRNHFKWKIFKQQLGLQNKKGHQDALDLQEWRTLFSSVGFHEVSVIPDHWPAMKWSHFLLRPLGFTVNYGKVPEVNEGLEFANEFIFLLRK